MQLTEEDTLGSATSPPQRKTTEKWSLTFKHYEKIKRQNRYVSKK
jgi:hypothetical protein